MIDRQRDAASSKEVLRYAAFSRSKIAAPVKVARVSVQISARMSST
jgi:hypothetical protein